MAQAGGGERILASDVEDPALGRGGVTGDRHGLDEAVGVALHEHAVLEGAGLALVGVADQPVGAHGLSGHARPLSAGREGGASAAHQAGLGDLADDAGRAELDGAAKRLVTAGRAVGGQAGGIDGADPAQQAKIGGGLLGRGGGLVGRSAGGERGLNLGDRGLAPGALGVLSAGLGQHRGGRLLAQAQTGALEPGGAASICSRGAGGLLQRGDQGVGPACLADHVLADVHDAGGAR